MKCIRSIPGLFQRVLPSVIALFFLVAPVTLWGANCPFCYSKAASSSPGLAQALRSGILILMFPPMLMSIGFTVMAYRRRNTFHSSDDQE